MQPSPPSVTSYYLGPNIFLSTLSLCSFFNVSDKFSHPYETTSKTTVLYILIFTFLAVNWNILGNNTRKSKLHS